MINYKVGDIIEAKVSGITKYGIFVHVDALYSGLIHISEISNCFIEKVGHYVRAGEIIYCEILGIDEEKHHLRLSIKNINYKIEVNPNEIVESRSGFLPLKNKLQEWIDEKVDEYGIGSK